MSQPNQKPRGASVVDGEFEVGYDQDFEARFRWLEWAGRAFLLAIVFACLAAAAPPA